VTIVTDVTIAARQAESRAFALRRHVVTSSRRHGFIRHGFTLIELLVVMAIVSLLLTLALPRYFHSTDKAREAVLKENLAQMRTAIDQYYADRGSYPERLEDLVDKRYLRRIPEDPVNGENMSWILVPPQDSAISGIYDIRSGANGMTLDGKPYSEL
jgi:general secretion pathway protein G